jgi:hypothetical protein
MTATRGDLTVPLYHSPVIRPVIPRCLTLLACGLAVLPFAIDVVAAGPVLDRLDRYRALAADRLGLAQLVGEPGSADAYRDLYALLDEEVVESLATGGVFASAEFLQDRLDAFGEAWGTTSVQLVRTGPLVVGAVQLGEVRGGQSVRVYGRLRDEPALLTTLAGDGHPSVYGLPPAAGGVAQFLVAWEGPPAGGGARPLRIDHLRHEGDGVRTMWSTARAFPEGLVARGYAVRGTEFRVRYELHYPGWTPGCEGQTEQEDLFRLAPGAGGFTRVAQRQLNGWHREFRRSVSQFFAALTAGDRAALAGLVPDAATRSRLPVTLRPEPACDAVEGTAAETVSVAATAEHDPWQLTFRRAGARWRLMAADPVLR